MTTVQRLGTPLVSRLAADAAEAPAFGARSARLNTPLAPRSATALDVGRVAGVPREIVARDSDPMTHIVELASDAYAGRDSPSPGLNAAARYISNIAARYGLQGAIPDNPRSPFLQPFTVRSRFTGEDEHGHDQDLRSKARSLFQAGCFTDEQMSDADVRTALGPTEYQRVLDRGDSPRRVLSEKMLDEGNVNNVVARLEGTGPNKDEHVVVMAHYDHVGQRGSAIYNGADDNASGSAALLSMIPELTRLRDEGKLDRSVLFLWTAAEEKGLLGAEHFVRNPPPGVDIDPDKLFVLNLDMVGRLPANRLSVLDSDSRRRTNVLAPLVDQANQSTGSRFTDVRRDIQSLVNRQDGAAFSNRGVATVTLFEGLGRFGRLNPDYHRPTDTVDRMVAENGGEKVRNIVPFASELVRLISNFEPKQQIVPPSVGVVVPPSFEVNGKTVNFVDIDSVDSKVVLDVRNRTAKVRSTVRFEQSEPGAPVIDLVPQISGGTINGRAISAEDYRDIRDPDRQSSMKVVDRELPAGAHELIVEYDLPSVRFSGERVSFFQQFSDLTPRRFVEQFFPTNFEFDQYKNSLEFELVGTDIPHDVIANGEVTRDGNRFQIEFPSHYNAASFFVDVAPKDSYQRAEGVYEGLAGPIPILAYGSNRRSVERALSEAKFNLKEHERDFGPHPHPFVIVKVEGSGGMEYAGATRTSLGAQKHEQHHFYFARSMMPAGGNAGWFDEAAASLHDDRYPERSRPPRRARKLSDFSPWSRVTPSASYSHGADFLAHLNYLFRPIGGIRPVMRELFERYQWQPVTTEMIQAFFKEKAEGLDIDIDGLFDEHIYGRPSDNLGSASARNLQA